MLCDANRGPIPGHLCFEKIRHSDDAARQAYLGADPNLKAANDRSLPLVRAKSTTCTASVTRANRLLDGADR
jgi:hypothetical protein